MTSTARERTPGLLVGRGAPARSGSRVLSLAALRSVPRAGAPIPPGAPALTFTKMTQRRVNGLGHDNGPQEVTLCSQRYC